MAKLISRDTGVVAEPIQLRLGVNRIGRGPHNDFSIDHASVSALHCELELSGDSLVVRDLGSTNGTYLDEVAIKTGEVRSGQCLRLGSVELVVEFSEVRVALPAAFLEPVAPPQLATESGKAVCLHHDDREGMWKCTRCNHLYCTPCIHLIKRRGGKMLYLCPDCSGVCELLPEYVKQPKRNWLGFIKEKLDLTRLVTRPPKSKQRRGTGR